MKLSVDLETRSPVDLINEGAWKYATDPGTDVICLAYADNDGEPSIWIPGLPVPYEFKREGVRLGAWNADGFERLIWDFILTPEYGFPPVAVEQWECTAFKARCNNLPNKLENCARVLRTPMQKESRGRELIKLLCLPLADGSFCTDGALLEEMYEYCRQDVRTEMAIDRLLREPTAEEWRDFRTNIAVNERGIRIDRPLAVAAQAYAAEEEADLIARIEEVTDGAVTKARGERLKEWVVERLTPEQEQLLVKYRNGERKISLDKHNRARLLADPELDTDVAEVVEASDFAQRSSVGKFRAMELRADPDTDRVHGALLCNGASQSGRYSSRGLQVHNFVRDVLANTEEARADLIENVEPEDIVDYFEQPIMTILARMLRSALIPADGCVFLVSDWSAIEGRVAPWLADSPAGRKKLKLYADDEPVYEITASGTFRVPIDKVTVEQRQVGKVQELSFQYEGGQGAFLAMARGYGLQATAAEAERYKRAWRRDNPWAERMWRAVEKAAMQAVRHPGELFKAGRLTYFAAEGVLCGGKTLWCQLPCGRLLTYPDARLERVKTPWGDDKLQVTCLRAAFVPKAKEKEWPRSSLYGGELFNNAVQGTAASLLRDAVHECEEAGLNPVLHVHDEIVLETRRSDWERDALEFDRIMNTGPAWAKGLPLKAEVKMMERFGK